MPAIEDDPFQDLLDAYAAAVLARDVEAFVALHDADVRIFDMWGSWSVDGIGPWRAMTQEWFSGLGEERVVVTADTVQSSREGDLAVGHAILRFTAVSPDGRVLRWLDNRVTMALRRTGGVWTVFHAHTSAPIDPRSLKAQLQRVDDR